ncbi:CBS domain-containing protein [Streptomyces roseoverticillatus]|uniref:CBS domain-containing protein n=1 Tax=Streptomyces roseoverticillatus TaxID=66429 RepID=A0ABV3IY47_9ACTN
MHTPAVGEIMTAEVARARPGTAYEDLLRLLRRRRVSGVPVLDRDDKVVGVVSEKDLTTHRAPGGTAATLMTSPAMTVHPEQPAADAARIMERHHVNRLPVVDEEDRLIGIVTRGDLLRVFRRTDDAIRTDVIGRALPPPGGRSAVSVAVNDGMVLLDGLIPPGTDIPETIRLAWQVDGVTGVVSRMRTGGADAVDAG